MKNLKQIKVGQITHGMSKNSEYIIWQKMKNRCLNKNIKFFERWGGRGITICDEWVNSFENFYKDMGDKPSKNHSLDRIDNNKGYSKENCRWATMKEQARNTRRNNLITYQGVTKCLAEWAEDLKINSSTLRRRLKQNWDLEKIFTQKVRGINTFNN